MSNKEKKDFRGSIRVAKDSCFLEERQILQYHVNYNELEADWKIANIPNDIKAIHKEAGIELTPQYRDGYGLKDEIKGLEFQEIVREDEDHLRIKFGADTQSELNNMINTAMLWCERNNIMFGEDDGNEFCTFSCSSRKKQAEIADDMKVQLLRRNDLKAKNKELGLVGETL